jgi:ectonucleotide pyrophosphatase/phosphodiesterase family protein 5
MRAFLAVHGPAFAAGSHCGPVAQVDIYPLMCHILDIEPGHPHNGSLEPLMPLLASHETEDITAYITLITCEYLRG